MPSKYRYKNHLLRPPLPHLFHSNEPLSEDEHRLILATISCVQDEADRLKQIEPTEDSEVTYRQRLACEEFVSKHRALLHWTRRLPNELLINVFLCYVDDHTRIPWTISQVCQKWRFAALATPRLWRVIPLRRNYPSVAAERRFLAFLPSYLARSRQESIIFDWSTGPELYLSLLKILLQYCERWGDVQLAFVRGDMNHFQACFDSMTDRLQSLYSLKLVCELWIDYPVVAFKTAHKLKRLHLDATGIFWDIVLPLQWPWCQSLTQFTAFYNTTAQFPYVQLALFTNLVEINLRFRYWKDVMEHMHLSEATFPACKRFSFECITPLQCVVSSTSLFTLWNFPILEAFFISYHLLKKETLSGLALFVVRHARTLKSLGWRRNTTIDGACPVQDDFFLNWTMGWTMAKLKVLGLTLSMPWTFNFFLGVFIKDPEVLPILEYLEVQTPYGFKEKDISDLCDHMNLFVDAIQNPGRTRQRKQLVFRVRLIGLDITPQEMLLTLERWAKGSEPQAQLDSEIIKMQEWGMVLNKALGSREDDTMSREALAAITNAFDEMEDYEVKSALSIHATGLQYVVAACQSLDRILIDDEVLMPFSPRINGILARWAPLFMEHYQKWIVADGDSVLYLPPDSELRQNPYVRMLGVRGCDPQNLGDVSWRPSYEVDLTRVHNE